MKYLYDAVVTKGYDGDTVTMDIDLGMGVMLFGQKMRLFGLDTPELRGDERERGLLVRDYLRSLILWEQVQLYTFKNTLGNELKGKYGRWLARIVINNQDINAHLINEGMAEAKTY